jgi:sugar lactone lactonase YvrE
VLYGKGKYQYELVEGWAKYPRRYSMVDGAGLAVDSQDRIWVLTRGNHPIMVFDLDGNLLKTMGEEDIFAGFHRINVGAHGIRVGPDGCIYCADDTNHVVLKLSPDGKVIMTLGNKGKPSDTGYVKMHLPGPSMETIKRPGPPFNRPTGVALSSSGEIFVSDGYGNSRVHKFAPDGTLLLSWGEPGTGPGQFRLVHDIWVDKRDHVWACDRENRRIQVFDKNGKFLNQITNLDRPAALFIDAEDTVYVSELGPKNPGVSIFTIDGKLLARWGNQKGASQANALFYGPHSIAVDSRGDIYVGEIGCMTGNDAMCKFIRRSE